MRKIYIIIEGIETEPLPNSQFVEMANSLKQLLNSGGDPFFTATNVTVHTTEMLEIKADERLNVTNNKNT